jgi:hypothetical protein
LSFFAFFMVSSCGYSQGPAVRPNLLLDLAVELFGGALGMAGLA